MNSATAAVITPMLRTVLICDIVESTALVERLGDVRAVALLQRHDQLMRQAMELCHGRLIDKADGMLALFERPIQALDFALRYQRGLRELGAVEGLDLKARVGIHVGDVMTWPNSPQDVLAGAKPFEVEGLAKPVAARLMNLALPGQILMSGMAQNLCQRAAGELGAAGTNLRWLLHGRYNFKGVPAPMLVHEVGEPGLSPLRAPESGTKAWRELPVWRRPPMLAIEVLAIAALGIGLFWTTLRSQPAIAFAERDWVVVADLQNRTSEKIFDDSLDTALRVGLEQSRHVNLISELQVDRALERMQRQGQAIDRQLATELALREGAKAVILPTIAEVGGVVRVSLEVIDPNSGVTVYSESADGRDSAGVLPAMDVAIARVRGSLGEALASVESSSKPLDTVTTGDLEALRAYSLAVRARAESRMSDARALLQEAVKRDPKFAMAYLNLAFLAYVENDAEQAQHYLGLAIANRDHLSQREALFLDGAAATIDNPALALEKFKLLRDLYPDEYRAYYNYAYFAKMDLLRDADALAMIGGGLVPKNPRLGSLRYLAATIHLTLNQYDQAQSEFEQAESLGVKGSKREYRELFAAQRRYDIVQQVTRLQTQTGSSVLDLESRLIDVTVPLDQGQWTKAVAVANQIAVQAEAADYNELTRSNRAGAALVVRSYVQDPALRDDLRAYAAARLVRLPQADKLEQRHVLLQALASAWLAARGGDLRTARGLVDAVEQHPMLAPYPAHVSMRRMVLAELALAEGDPQRAIGLLAGPVRAGEGLYLERSVLMRAYAAAEDWPNALAQADWLATNRGRAYVQSDGNGLLQPANVAESTLALRSASVFASRLGQASRAKDAEAAFTAAWPGEEGQAIAARLAMAP